METQKTLIKPDSKPDTQAIARTEQLMKAIRQTPLFRQLIPMEAAIGWPIPLRKANNVYVTLPFFGANRNSQGNVSLVPPFATITLNWSNSVPVQYVNLRFDNPAPELNWENAVGTFPHPAIKQMTVKEYEEKRQELLRMYDEMFEMLSQNHSFSPEWCQRFSGLLRTLVEPPLEPYYRAIGGKFFDRFLIE